MLAGQLNPIRGGARPGSAPVALVTVVALTAFLVLSSLPAARPAGAAPLPGQDDWPMFHRDPHHTGVSAESAIRASNSGTLGLAWQTNTGDATYTSPAVAYNATLDKTLIYQGNKRGVMSAFDAANGERIWYFNTGGAINSSPAKLGNTLYFGSANHVLYAVDATTGQLQCSFDGGGNISSSPVAVKLSGVGDVVFFGDNGLTGGDDGGHLYAVNGVDPNSEADCSRRWVFESFGDPPGSQPAAGVWSPPAFTHDVTGRAIIVAGSSSPDNAVYAWDARTGQVLWRYQTQVFFVDNDVGTGPAISPPGVNGFANGVAYIVGKNKIAYALDLSTGRPVWQFSIRNDAPHASGLTRSSPALVDGKLFFGFGGGVYALDAKTGAKLWRFDNAANVEVISSPAVTGPAGDRVLFVGDLTGQVYALSADGGSQLWSYDTGSFIYGSFAISAEKAYVGSSNGYLYAFAIGGGGSGKPDVAVTTPGANEVLPNPNGQPVAVSGTAADDIGVRQVRLSVKDKNRNMWWDAALGKWSRVFVDNAGVLSDPGQRSTRWSWSFPSSFYGGRYMLQADAVDTDGQHSAPPAVVDFSVASEGSPPETTITSPKFKQVFRFSSPDRQSFPITITGTAVDSGGRRPGIASVYVVVQNIEHGEYYCGPSGCGTTQEVDFHPTYRKVEAVLAEPGAVSTSWSLTFPTYDHPHKYSIAAWAVDSDGEVDQTKARVQRICVRDFGDTSLCG